MSAVLRAVGEAFTRLAGRVVEHVDQVVRHAHRPEQTGGGVACLWCCEPWPCEKLAVYESRRDDQR
jgi:hypothetical protein